MLAQIPQIILCQIYAAGWKRLAEISPDQIKGLIRHATRLTLSRPHHRLTDTHLLVNDPRDILTRDDHPLLLAVRCPAPESDP
jgi:hypothetical protein